jgi:hypothetical protein
MTAIWLMVWVAAGMPDFHGGGWWMGTLVLSGTWSAMVELLTFFHSHGHSEPR